MGLSERLESIHDQHMESLVTLKINQIKSTGHERLDAADGYNYFGPWKYKTQVKNPEKIDLGKRN